MLYIGDDWAEDHHDVELMDAAGRTLSKARLPEGVIGIAKLHEMIARQLDNTVDADGVEVIVGTETDRGLWICALIASGYSVFGVNPLQVARYRERHSVSGAKSDPADAHTLADMVRTDNHQLRPVAADSEAAQAIKVVTRAHKSLIWERTRHTLRLRCALRDYFPAALEAFKDLDASEALELLAKAPDPAEAARLTLTQITAALRRARRRNIADRAHDIQAALRAQHLVQPREVTQAYVATTRATVAVLVAISEQVKILQAEVEARFGRHPDAEIIASQPGFGQILGARVIAEFGDDPIRYRDAKGRKNYAGTSPVTRASGRRRVVTARHVHNDRLVDALMSQAFASLTGSPGARAYYDAHKKAGADHNDALRRLANRLVGILHGCLKTRTLYDEATAWSHRNTAAA